MQKLKKAVKSVGGAKVHPTNSMDADTEMAEPPRRRRQSFSSEVPAEDASSGRMSPSPALTLQRISGRRPSSENIAARPTSLNSESGVSPMLQPASPSPSETRRRRSLSSGRDGGTPVRGGSPSPAPSRRGNMEQWDASDVARSSPVENDHHLKFDRAHRKISVITALKGDYTEPVAAPRQTAEHIQSQALQHFFSSAQSSNSWSASSKKMIFASEIGDSKLQNRGKLEARKVFFCKMLAYSACLSTLVACLTSRFEEDARNTLVTDVIQKVVADCCGALNATLSFDGSCPATLEDGKSACVPDNSLLSTYDTDSTVAPGTDVYTKANAGRALVSLLSLCNVFLLTTLYVVQSQYQALLEHLERNQTLADTKRIMFPEVSTIVQYCAEAAILFLHLPPGNFDSPVLVINSVYYGQPRVLKYPWVALSSLFCTLRLYTVLKLARDLTLIKWSSKKKLLERQAGISINTAFALKVMMDESPIFVVGVCFSFVWIVSSYWMLVFERNHTDIRRYVDAIWLGFITSSTVGYGDLYPQTMAGRFVSVMAGIYGIILAALGTAALCRGLALTSSEFKVKNLIGRGDMDRVMCVCAATYIQRFYRFKLRKPSPYATFFNPAPDMRTAANEFTAAKQNYDVWLKSQVNLMISLKRMLEESEIIMKFTNLLSNDTGENTKHFQLDVCGYDTMPQLEASIRELRDYLKRMWNQAPSNAKAIAEANQTQSREAASNDSRVEASVDLSVLGNRIRSLADMCKDNNRDLESACISVQRSGVGFVNARELGVQPQKMQQNLSARSQNPHSEQSQPQALPPQYPPQHPQQQLVPPPFQQQLQSDMAATTQTVMQLANIKLMQKLVGAISRMADSGSDRSYSSENDSGEDSQLGVSRPTSASSQRPISASSQRPLNAAEFESSASQRPISSSGLRGEHAQQSQSVSSAVGRAGSAPRSQSGPQQTAGFVGSDEARSRGAQYMQ